MNPDWEIHDDVIEAIVRGDAPDEGWLSPLVAFTHQVREIGEGSPPAPSADLRSLLASDEVIVDEPSGLARSVELVSVAAPVAGPLAAAEQARHTRGGLEGDTALQPSPNRPPEARHLRRQERPSPLASLFTRVGNTGLVARGMAAAVGMALLVMTAGVANVAPSPVNRAVQATISTITPFDFSAQAKHGATETDSQSDPEVGSEPESEPGPDTQHRADRDRGEAPADRAPVPEEGGSGDSPAPAQPDDGGGGLDDVIPEDLIDAPIISDLPEPPRVSDHLEPPLPDDDRWLPWLDDIPYLPSPSDEDSDDGLLRWFP